MAAAVVELADLALRRLVVVEDLAVGRSSASASTLRLGVAGLAAPGLRSTPPARGTRRANPSADSSPARTAARASAPSRRRRSRTARRRPAAARSTASSRWCRARGSGRGRSGSRAARCRSPRSCPARAHALQRGGVASTGARMRMSSPAVSWSFEVPARLRDDVAVVGARFRRARRSPAWPVARARLTASFTQSRIGRSRVLAHAPDVARLHRVLDQHLARGVDHAHRAGGRRSRTSCRASRIPPPPAPSARRSTRCPSSHVERAVLPGSRRSSPGRSRRSSGPGIIAFMSCSLPSGPHIWPEARIAAGIEASMITSLGTCRLVMPLSIHHRQRRPRRVDRLDVGFDRRLLSAGSA